MNGDREVELDRSNSELDTSCGSLGRLGYFGGMMGVVIFYIAIEATNYDDPVASGRRGVHLLALGVGIVVSLILTVNRLKNIGMSGWWSLLTLIPIVCLYINIKCLICQKGYKCTKKLDRVGQALLILIIGSFLLILTFIIVVLAILAARPY